MGAQVVRAHRHRRVGGQGERRGGGAEPREPVRGGVGESSSGGTPPRIPTHVGVAESRRSAELCHAARLGVELEQRADDFLRLSDATANAMTPLACTKRRRVPAVHWAMLAAIVADAARLKVN